MNRRLVDTVSQIEVKIAQTDERGLIDEHAVNLLPHGAIKERNGCGRGRVSICLAHNIDIAVERIVVDVLNLNWIIAANGENPVVHLRRHESSIA